MLKNKTTLTLERFIAPLVITAIILIWQIVCWLKVIPPYLLPSPIDIIIAFTDDLPLLLLASLTTLSEAAVGLVTAVVLGLGLAIALDSSPLLERAVSPLLLLTQTVPPVALAPLLILWLGYGVLPKIVLVFLTCFFPITMGMLTGFKQADADAIVLLKSMGATKRQIYQHIKLPSALPEFFSGVRIASSYAIVGAVISEWLGGKSGLGVYMTRVIKSYSFDKMFAVIFLVSALSILLIQFIKFLERKIVPWNYL